MGLLLNIYRSANGYDATNGGVSSKYGMVCVINAEGPFEPTDEIPAVMLVDDKPMGRPYPKLVPVKEREDGRWLMFGGNYAASSDSRFADAVEATGAGRVSILPVFDRVEF